MRMKNPEQRARKKFLHFFREGFHGQKYLDWERGYKWNAHLQWKEELNEVAFRELLAAKKHSDIALAAARIESRTNLLFSFEKMALRDAVKNPAGAKTFAAGLFDYLYGEEAMQVRFENWVNAVSQLPRKQTRVLTWPLVTVFGFLGNPREHIFLKPLVTKEAARAYGYNFQYAAKPNWNTYQSLLGFAKRIKKDVADLKPRDYIDLQSFIWVLGSSEYEL
jgi:hypothetical protein